MIDPVSVAELGIGVYDKISGIFKKKKADQLMADNPRPVETVPAEVLAAQAKAEQLSNEGLPAAEYNQAQQEIAKNAQTAIAASGDRRSALATVGAVQQQTNDATNKLNVASAEQRVANIKNLATRSDITAQWKDKVWDYNERQRYEENAAAIRALQGAGAEEGNQGTGEILGGLLTGNQKTGFLSKLLGGLGKMGNMGSNLASVANPAS